jgi:hypothetical protein
MASLSSPHFAAKAISATRAFSSEVETGSRQENPSKQQSGARFRFYRNGKGSSGNVPDFSGFLGSPACRSDGAGTAVMGFCRIFESSFFD